VTDVSYKPSGMSAAQDADRRRRQRSTFRSNRLAAYAPASSDRLSSPAAKWQRDYRHLALSSDLVVVLVANLLGLWLRYGVISSATELAREGSVLFRMAAFLVAGGWMLAIFASGCYDDRALGSGSDEFKRVTNASVRLAAVTGFLCYLTKTDISRGYIATTLILGTVGLLASRYALREYVYWQRRTGDWSHRLLAVGTREAVCELIAQTRAEPKAGFTVIAACLPRLEPDLVFAGATVPVVGALDDVEASIAVTRADSVAVTRAPEISSEWLTRLAWKLEGRGVTLAVAPALTNVAGPRISIRPVAGLPLLHVEEPELSGSARLVKNILEKAIAGLALVLLAPLLLLLALVIRLDSRGPVLFRQERVGERERPFRLYKFRSMHIDAEPSADGLVGFNEADPVGLHFKVRDDPRITRVGRVLRRFSLDELPQLINVVRGDMALVGPRPPLPSEVARYADDYRRRLIVKPGITGLWQVSGRADLSWDDTVRLDLYYVENWSLALDIQILWKTIFAVVRARGAY
jgi:exopolysaccharide biosynthesis polyprenyl glycosylphosphotransferase